YLQSLSSSTRRSACLAAPRVLSPPKTSGAGARFRIERLGAEIFPPRVSRMAILSVRATRSAAASSDFDRLSAGESLAVLFRNRIGIATRDLGRSSDPPDSVTVVAIKRENN